jgi:hypothetical protein
VNLELQTDQKLETWFKDDVEKRLQLKIIELRHKAEKDLGSKFDIRKFHAKVLESGVMPLALLEKKIDDWIASSK